MIYVLYVFIAIFVVYVVGFLYCFLRVLFENDYKLGKGPNWNKFWFGLAIGAVWPWLVYLAIKQG